MDQEDDFFDGCDDDPCDHEHADIDLLTGIMSCSCGYSKWLTSEELEEECRLQAIAYEEYHRLCEAEAAE